MFTIIWFEASWKSRHPQDWEEKRRQFESMEAAISFAKTVLNPEYKTFIQGGGSNLKIEIQSIQGR